jgi:hypothetical protein
LLSAAENGRLFIQIIIKEINTGINERPITNRRSEMEIVPPDKTASPENDDKIQ